MITVDGRPVAELGPCHPRRWVTRQRVVELLAQRPADPSFFDDVAELGGTLAELDART